MARIMKIPAPVKKVIDDLRAQFTARFGRDLVLSDRLKALVAAIAFILLASSLVGLHQFVTSLERSYVSAQVDMTRLESQIRTNVWQGRKQQSQVLKSVLEERLWTAQTPGLADANFERWLRDRMGRYKMEPIQQIQIRRVAVNKSSAAGGDKLAAVQRMTAKIVLPFDPQGLNGFLADVAEGDKTVVIDRLNVLAGRNPRVEMDISAFYWSPEKS
jgi:hypothetical protein